MLPGETLCSGANEPEGAYLDVYNGAVFSFIHGFEPFSRETAYAKTHDEAVLWLGLMEHARELGVSWVQMPELFTFIRR